MERSSAGTKVPLSSPYHFDFTDGDLNSIEQQEANTLGSDVK